MFPKKKKSMFEEMGEYAGSAENEALRKKYGAPPEVEDVPGAGEEDPLAADAGSPSEDAAEGVSAEDVEAFLAQLSPDELNELLTKV